VVEHKAILELDCDFGSGLTTGVFEMYGDVEVTEGVLFNFPVGGRGSALFGVAQKIVDGNNAQRAGFTIDVGGGQHLFEISFRGWEGAKDRDGNDLQWGDDSSPGLTTTSATGQHPTSQVNVFMHYLTIGTYDSAGPARLTFGEYSSGGVYSEDIPVTFEGQPQLTRKSGDTVSYTGSITLSRVLETEQALDVASRLGV